MAKAEHCTIVQCFACREATDEVGHKEPWRRGSPSKMKMIEHHSGEAATPHCPHGCNMIQCAGGGDCKALSSAE
jgi:hypothetical protein